MSAVHGDRIRIGTVVRPHGIRGELVVAAEGDTLRSLSPGATIWIGDGGRTIVALRQHKRRWLLAIDKVCDRNQAEALRGSDVFVAPDRLEPLGEHEVWADDLDGYRVESAEGEPIGVVIGVRVGSPHDLLEVDTGSDSILIPMVMAWLVEFSRQGRYVRLALPEGLVAGQAAGQ